MGSVRTGSIALVIALMLVACPSAASADIFAFTETAPGAPRTDTDLALIDASTGVFDSLPAGINTTAASEFHPSVTADGNRVVFQRHDFAAGTTRIILADLTTGQTADLFNGFEAVTYAPTSPAITPDGTKVLTGGPFDLPPVTDVTAFPTGPYPHTTPFKDVDQLVDPVITGTAPNSLLAFRRNTPESQPPATVGSIILKEFGQGAALPTIADPNVHYAHPAIGTPAGVPTVLFDQHPVSSSGDILQGSIGFCSLNSSLSRCTFGVLPPIVNSSLNETRPAFTPDSRYVGFIRDETNGHERLFVWDSQTQTLINDGIDLGPLLTPDSGNLSLFVRPVFSFTSLSIGSASFSLLQPSSVGIMVQRVVGHHKLFGRTVPTLKFVGRIPLGTFRAGRRHVHWRLRVNGKRLRPGTYQLTVRALTKTRSVRDMGKPRMIRVRR